MISQNRLARQLSIGLLFFLSGTPGNGWAAAEATEDDLSRRPGVTGEPTVVLISCALTDIHEIDDVDQTVDATMAVFLRWSDSRLAHGGRESVFRPLDTVWDPGIVVFNGGDRDASPARRVEIRPDGTVILEQVFRGFFEQTFDLRQFPFDRQVLDFSFLSLSHRPEELLLTPDPDSPSRLNPECSVPNWEIMGWEAETAELRLVRNAPGRSVFRMKVEARRESGFFVFKVILPLILILFMSWLVYWIHPSKVDAQIGVGATSILTLIAFRFTIDNLLPGIPYLTRLDLFILLSMVMVFANLIESVATAHLYMSGREELAVRIDRRGRWLYPAVLLGVVVYTLLVPR